MVQAIGLGKRGGHARGSVGEGNGGDIRQWERSKPATSRWHFFPPAFLPAKRGGTGAARGTGCGTSVVRTRRLVVGGGKLFSTGPSRHHPGVQLW